MRLRSLPNSWQFNADAAPLDVLSWRNEFIRPTIYPPRSPSGQGTVRHKLVLKQE